jgi:hypothetical protein
MRKKVIEATSVHGGGSHCGHFFLLQLGGEDWNVPPKLPWEGEGAGIPGTYLPPRLIGPSPDNVIVFELRMSEGAAYRPAGFAENDLDREARWWCLMDETFLHWLSRHDTKDITKLPDVVYLDDDPGAFLGNRCEGNAYFSEGEGI